MNEPPDPAAGADPRAPQQRAANVADGGGPALLAAHRMTFRAFAEAVAPETAHLDENGWAEVEATIERMLQTRPPKMRRQIIFLLRILDRLPLIRYGRRLSSLDAARRHSFLEFLERSPVPLVRRGVWGLRTLVFMGFYTRTETMQAVGYRATVMGWSARTRPVP